MWPAAIAALEAMSASVRSHDEANWPRWFEYVDDRGLNHLELSPTDVEAFLSPLASPHSRTVYRSGIRRLYRAAHDLGLVAAIPVPDCVVGEDRRKAHLLTDDEVAHLVRTLCRTATERTRALRARRDLALVALTAWCEFNIDELLGLTWADVDIDS